MSTNQSNKPRDEAATPPVTAPDFFINTSPEMDALERAAADGKWGHHYQNIEQQEARVHQIAGAPHFVKLELTDAERSISADTKILEKLTKEQDADSALAFLYIARLLAPPSPLAPNTAATGKIDFDDVLSKIGWTPRSTVERREMHRRIHQFILFGERAQVVGQRRGRYIDKHTGEEIRTQIRSALWRIVKTETPEEGSFYPEPDVPVAVELMMAREWTELLTHPKTAQYLPMGELLGAIPGNKPSGAWARVIGLALASFWRRLPRESLDGSIKPTRRELLERYPPKTGSVDLLLNSKYAGRAIVYWCDALDLLVNAGFLANEGEPSIGAIEMRKRLPHRDWTQCWLNQTVQVWPASSMRETIAARSLAVANAPISRRRKSTKSTF